MTRNGDHKHLGAVSDCNNSIILNLVSLKVSACQASFLLNIVLFFINCMLACFFCVIENTVQRAFMLEKSFI